MPTPSIVNATAVGKEVIRRTYIDGQAESPGTILTGVANHIMTIVSIIICDVGNVSDATFSLYIDYEDAGGNLYLTNEAACGSKATYVWSDRFAIISTDKLHIVGASAGSTAAYDVWCTYIDQQFAAP